LINDEPATGREHARTLKCYTHLYNTDFTRCILVEGVEQLVGEPCGFESKTQTEFVIIQLTGAIPI